MVTYKENGTFSFLTDYQVVTICTSTDVMLDYNTTQVGVLNNQNINSTGFDILQQQLTVKDEQIKQLLNLLNK